MRIQPINLYNNINTNPMKKQQPALKASAPDMFVKSPSFGSHTKLMPFFEGGIEYTTENLKKFNSILKNINLSDGVLKTLIDRAKAIPQNIKYEQDFTFNWDFLIRHADENEISDIGNWNFVYNNLPKIKFTKENSSKVDSILDRALTDAGTPAFLLTDVMDDALEEENIPLLKILLKNNGQYFKKFINSKDWQIDSVGSYIKKGKESKNPEIVALFSGENLYNFLKDFYSDCSDIGNTMINAEFLAAMPPSGQRNYYINDFFAENSNANCLPCEPEALAMVPMSDWERKVLLGAYMLEDEDEQIKAKKAVLELMENRFQNIVYRNGFDAPINLLNCLKDGIMSEEMLTQKFENTTLIEEIAQIPLDESNQKIMSEIIGELSKYPHLKENESYRNAGILAARQGNAELLKFLDSRHIHYANNLKEPIESYPNEVQDILKNAKVSDTEIFQYADSPEKLNRFLENNPRVDINTLNDEGETLLMVSANNQDLKMFECLANRDDVDLNIVNEFGENVLMQVISLSNETNNSSFAKKAIKILRNQPSERFDINYVNYTPGLTGMRDSYSALTDVLFYGEQKDLIEEILKFPNLDTNFDPMNEEPLLFANRFSLKMDKNVFEKLFFHPNTDLDKILACVNANAKNVDNEELELLNSCMEKRIFLDIKNVYDEDGFLTLDEIEKLVNADNEEKHLCHEKINIVGENIGHMLAETRVDENNPQEMKQLRRVFRNLQKLGYDFNSKDDFGVTPLAKAIECQNEPLEDMFRIYSDED